jgi:hypothetical protein
MATGEGGEREGGEGRIGTRTERGLDEVVTYF